MQGRRVRWRNVGRVAAVAGALIAIVVIAPKLLREPGPAPPPPDVGLAPAPLAAEPKPKPRPKPTPSRPEKDNGPQTCVEPRSV